MDIDAEHFGLVAAEIVDGAVVPFLGAGANLCDRRPGASWEPGRFAPSGRELAKELATQSRYPNLDDLDDPDRQPDLQWVSQYFDAVLGDKPLYRKLREVFEARYPPTSLHRLLARMPALMRKRGAEEQLLVLTTNYDELLERALDDAGEPFDVVWYDAKPGPNQGHFWHRTHERVDGQPVLGEAVLIETPSNEYLGLSLKERPVVLKLHGATDPKEPARDSYVLTEDSYIDYLAGPAVGKQLPPSLIAKLADSHFLFLGYSMRDWNMRVILKQLWGSEQLGSKSWAVQLEQSDPAARKVERQLWSHRGDVDLLYAPLKDYVQRLGAELRPGVGAVTDTLAPPQETERRLPGTPFVGLVPYGEGDAAFFFGRDREKEVITANLRAPRLTILYGASGCGKTSVLQAGVVHDLREQVRANATGRTQRTQRLPFAICAFSDWHDEPLPPLAEAMRAAAVEALDGKELRPWSPGESLVGAVRDWTDGVRRLLVVLDQFEEYFLYHADEDGDGTFAVEFPRLVNEPNLRVNFVLSLREDALAKLDRFKGRIPALFENYIRVAHLDRKAARQAIDGPVGRWNELLRPGEEHYDVEPALAERVIEAAASGRRELAEGGDGAGGKAADAYAVEAPFLQLVLERLWRETVAAGAHTLDLARLEALGGAQQIVENYLLEALGKLTSDEQAVAADVFRFLVTRSKTKIAHPASDLADWTKRPEPEVAAVLEKLCLGESGRILRRVSPPAGETVASYELFHDVLAEPVLDWRKGYEQQREQEAEAQRQREEQEAEKEWRRRRRLRWLVAALVLTTLAFALLLAWALVQRDNSKRAEASARSVALASASNDQLAAHLDVALLLSLAAVSERDTAQARGSMISALAAFQRTGAQAILRSGQSAVVGVAFSPDGSTLAAAGFDGQVVLWDARDYSRLTTQPSPGISSARKPATTLDSGQSRVNGVAFSPDGNTLAAAGADGQVVLWDAARDYGKLTTLASGQDAVYGVAFSRDGTTLAAAGSDGQVVLWDAAHDYSKLTGLVSGQSSVRGVAFSPDGNTLAAAGFDGKVVLWNAARNYRKLKALDSGQSSVNGVAFNWDGKTLAAAGSDGQVVLWDAARDYRKLTTLTSGQSPVNGVAFSPDGTTLAAAGDDGKVVLWDAARDYGKLATLASRQPAVYGVAFSRDGNTLAAAGSYGQVVLWDAAHDYRKVTTLASGQPAVNGVAFSPEGKTLAAAGFDGKVVLWDARNYRKLRALESGQSAVVGVAFSRDGTTLAAAGDDGKVVLWDAAHDYRKLTTLASGQPAVYGVAFSPDGKTLAAAGFEGKVVLWDAAHDYGELTTLASGQSAVYGVAFSRDGKTLAAAGDEGKVVLWDAAHDYRELEALDSGQSSVTWVAFSPDGHTLAAAGDDGKVVLWDAARDDPNLPALDSGQRIVLGVAFSRDGSTLAVAGDDGKVVLWDIFWHGLSDMEKRVCGLVSRDLTQSDWETFAPGIRRGTICST